MRHERFWPKEARTACLFVVDQFEEVSRSEDRSHFIAELLSASTATYLSVLLTVRSDSYENVMELNRELAQALRSRQEYVIEMNEDELRMTIEGPARRVRLSLEGGLASRLLDDVQAEPGGLPLLQYALTMLWKPEKNGPLTHAAYEQAGGVKHAIANAADLTFRRLSPDMQRAAKRLFMRLVHKPDSSHGPHGDTRRVATRAEVGEEAWSVAQAFAADKALRILVLSGDVRQTDATVDVAHEALLRAWQRLKDWSAQDDEFIRWREKLQLLLVKQDPRRAAADSIHDSVMADAQQWYDERREELNQPEIDFILSAIHDPAEVRNASAQGFLLLQHPRIVASHPELVGDWCAALICARKFTALLAELERATTASLPNRVIATLIDAQVLQSSPGYARQILSACAKVRQIRDKADREQVLAETAEGFARIGDAESAISALIAIDGNINLRSDKAVRLASLIAVSTTLEAGLRASKLIVDIKRRREALKDIVVKLTLAAKEQAAALAAEIGLRELAEPKYPNVPLLVSSLQILVRAGSAEPAINRVSEIRDTATREELISGIALEMVRASDHESALRLASELVDATLRGSVQLAAADSYLAAGQIGAARVIGETCDIPRHRAEILIRAGGASAGAGLSEDAIRSATEAETLCHHIAPEERDAVRAAAFRLRGRVEHFIDAKSVKAKVGLVQNAGLRQELYLVAVVNLATGGKLAEADEIAQEANQIHSDPVDPNRIYRMAFAEVVRTLTMDGRFGEAIDWLQKADLQPAQLARSAVQSGRSEDALRFAGATADTKLSRELRIGVIDTLLETGGVDAAREVAKSIDDAAIVERVAVAHAIALTKAGHFDDAEEVARTISSAGQRANTLSAIAFAVLRTSSDPQMIQNAVPVALATREGRALGLATQAWARARRHDEALSLAQQAETLAARMDLELGIAIELTNAGKTAEARDILNAIIPNLLELPERTGKNQSEGPVATSLARNVPKAAQALASLSDFDIPLELVKRIPDRALRQITFSEVLERLAEDGQTDRALELLNSGEDLPLGLRFRVKAKIARLLARRGLPDQAQTIVEIDAFNKGTESVEAGPFKTLDASSLLNALTEIAQAFVRNDRLESALEMAAELNDVRMRAAVITNLVGSAAARHLLDGMSRVPGKTGARLWPVLARSLSRAGRWPEALLAAGRIEDKPVRGGLLVEIALTFIDNQRAADAVVAAMQAFDDLSEPVYADEQFLSLMFQALARARNTEAVLQQLQALRSERHSAVLLLEIARQMGKEGKLAEALDLCKRAPPEVRSRAYRETAAALAEAGYASEAERLAHLSEEEIQPELRTVLARSWAALGDAAQSFALCDLIPAGKERGRALSVVARTLNDKLQREDGHRAASRAFEELSQASATFNLLRESISVLAQTAHPSDMAALVFRVTPPTLYGQVLAAFARAMVQAGRHEEAFQFAANLEEPALRLAVEEEAKAAVTSAQDLDVAVRFASSLSVFSRPRRLAGIVRELAGRQDWENAETIAEAALQALRQVQPDITQAAVSGDVAYVLAEAAQYRQTIAAARMSTAAHRQTAIERLVVSLSRRGLDSEALEAARQLPNRNGQQRAFAKLALSFANLGRRDPAGSALRELENTDARPELLALLAIGLADAKALDDGQRIAERIEHSAISARTLVAISEKYADAGDYHAARAAVRAAWNVAAKIGAFDEYSKLMVSIASAYARVKSYRDALSAMENCELASDRLAAACAILYWDSFHRHPEIADYAKAAVHRLLSDGGGQSPGGSVPAAETLTLE